MLPYGRHHVDQDDIDAVTDVLKNQFLTQGACVPAFEQALCDYTGADYAQAVNSGTSGLHIACLAAGVGEGDIVWTVPNSFVASANCAKYCGADIDFVDMDPVTRNLSVALLQAKIEGCETLPKALIVVHFSGASCDMQAISAMTRKHNIILIEDAAHALGGCYNGKPIGNCEYSDMAVFSFHPVKSITTAEGGAVITNDKKLYKRLVLFAKHGITRDPQQLVAQDQGDWYYEQQELGYNYRLSDLHAALGISQLRKLDHFIHFRRKKAAVYLQALAKLPLILPPQSSLEDSAWHLFMIELKDHDRRVIFEQLRARGIGVNVHYIPIHLQPYYQRLGFKLGNFPNAEGFYSHALTLPLFPLMSDKEQQQVIDVLHQLLV
ncbi:MAG: UDP-4-amino-4,6-dideoxy-N-acetyl-beta-L-altrosamine transaminase [Paraglaciecola sp.]|jgi:UDP-4-amino-4,6-dideoxy-N-acetyl-beta-L-altrosamine transaminase